MVELEYHLELHKPHIVLLQETWLDASTESVSIANYIVISRRDRSEKANRGGVLTLARSDFNRLVHIENSKVKKRSWHFLHMDPEILLLGNWYRPGATEHDAYAALQEEMGAHVLEATGIILSGDLNVHHARWLRFSNGNTVQGSDLKTVCDNLGLQQLVNEPTRQEYLLDLYLTDVAGTKVRVGSYVADHKYLIATVPMPEVTTLSIKRERFNLLRADWSGLKTALANVDWSPMQRDTADAAASFFMEMLWMNLCTYIPYKQIEIRKKSHPWLNSKCKAAIQAKNVAENTDSFIEARKRCAQVLAQEHQAHIGKVRKKIAKLKKGSKAYWRLNRELLNKKTKCSSIPPLRDGTKWVNDPKDKADLFAKTFDTKANLPDESVDCPFFGKPDVEFDEFVALRTRYTLKILKGLDESKATGPDRIPSSILKRIANEIAGPFTVLCRRLLREACWPRIWRLHLICPLYKRGSAFSAGNYRGVHLTAVLSKVAERVIGRSLVTFLHSGKFGPHQWAFTPGFSARDLVTALVMSWILAICTGHKVGTYLGNISGAFDRVYKDYLLAKLQAAGVGVQFLNFLSRRDGQL